MRRFIAITVVIIGIIIFGYSSVFAGVSTEVIERKNKTYLVVSGVRYLSLWSKDVNKSLVSYNTTSSPGSTITKGNVIVSHLYLPSGESGAREAIYFIRYGTGVQKNLLKTFNYSRSPFGIGYEGDWEETNPVTFMRHYSVAFISEDEIGITEQCLDRNLSQSCYKTGCINSIIDRDVRWKVSLWNINKGFFLDLYKDNPFNNYSTDFNAYSTMKMEGVDLIVSFQCKKDCGIVNWRVSPTDIKWAIDK